MSRLGFRLNEDEAWEFIVRAHTGYVTTLRRDGRPITLPVWFGVLDRRVYLRTPSSTAKLKRIRHDPRAYFLVESGEAWLDLKAVSFEARASIVSDPELSARVAALMEEKYAAHTAPPERLPEPVRAHYGDMSVVELEPVGRVGSWNNSALAL